MAKYEMFAKLDSMSDDALLLASEDEQRLQALLDEAKSVDERNTLIFKAAREAHAALTQFFRDNSTFYDAKKVMTRMKNVMPGAPRLYATRVLDRIEKAREARKRKQQEELAKKAAMEADMKKLNKYAAAIKYIEQRGYTHHPGESRITKGDVACAYSNPIDLANSIAFAEATKIEKDELISFSGDDECSNCGGWDGESTRCECGNRRVCWDKDGDFEDMNVYAVAY